jgi:RNA polymerase sigma factor (sigma-70 family)
MVLSDVEREKFIEDNLNLVYFVVHKSFEKVEYPGIDFDDLASVGSIGLIKAIDCFDEKFGVKFATYAVPTIHGYIARWLRDTTCQVKFPREVKDLWYQVNKNNMQDCTVDEIVEKLGATKKRAMQVMDFGKAKIIASLDFQIDESGTDAYETMVAYEPDFDSGLLIYDIRKRLSFKERQAFELAVQGKTQKEIANIFNCSQAYVSRMLIKIKGKVRKYLNEN